jgi:hypothetical protein
MLAAVATVCLSAGAAYGLRGLLVGGGASAPLAAGVTPSPAAAAAGESVAANVAPGAAAVPVPGGAATEPSGAAPQQARATAHDRAAPAATARPPRDARSGGTGGEPRVANVLAREALRAVGKDPAALAVWLRAVNDPNLPSGERSDLIEDLNDEGYEGQGSFTEGDLQLILARLDLIEQQMPLAMDDVNAVAFTEAYKDLLAMLAKARADLAARAKK